MDTTKQCRSWRRMIIWGPLVWSRMSVNAFAQPRRPRRVSTAYPRGPTSPPGPRGTRSPRVRLRRPLRPRAVRVDVHSSTAGRAYRPSHQSQQHQSGRRPVAVLGFIPVLRPRGVGRARRIYNDAPTASTVIASPRVLRGPRRRRAWRRVAHTQCPRRRRPLRAVIQAASPVLGSVLPTAPRQATCSASLSMTSYFSASNGLP